jgi:hypothetical protein
MKVLYLHGLHSRPGGVKATFLREQGHDLINPALPDDDFVTSIHIAQQALDEGRPDVIVGSSRGGAVALNIDAGTRPLVLIAPAWRRWGTAATISPRARAIVLHSPADAVIPFDDSRTLVRASGLPDATLVAVGADHNMVDPPALEALLEAISAATRPSH